MGKLREEGKAQEAHTIDIWQSSSFNDGNVKHTCSLSKLSGRTGLLPAFYQNKNKNKEIKLKPTIFLISKLKPTILQSIMRLSISKSTYYCWSISWVPLLFQQFVV